MKRDGWTGITIWEQKSSLKDLKQLLRKIIDTNLRFKELDTFDPKGIIRNFLETSRVETLIKEKKCKPR